MRVVGLIILASGVVSMFSGLHANIVDGDHSKAAMHYAFATLMMVVYRLDREPR